MNKNKIFTVVTIITVFLIFTMLILVTYTVFPLTKECQTDVDWPEKPCYKKYEYPGKEVEFKKWSEYYDFKGPEFMEIKKNEMIQALESGSLKSWIKQQGSIGDRDIDKFTNNTNHNVWFYYYLKGDIPSPWDGKYIPDDFGGDLDDPSPSGAACIIQYGNQECIMA